MAELIAHATVRIKDLNGYRKRSYSFKNQLPSNRTRVTCLFFFCRSSSKKDTKMTDRKAVIKNADMSEDMQQDAVDCATQAIEKYNIEKVQCITF